MRVLDFILVKEHRSLFLKINQVINGCWVTSIQLSDGVIQWIEHMIGLCVTKHVLRAQCTCMSSKVLGLLKMPNMQENFSFQRLMKEMVIVCLS